MRASRVSSSLAFNYSVLFLHFCSWALGALVPGAPLCSSRSPLEVLGSFSLFLGGPSLGFLGLAAGLLWFPSGAPFWVGLLWLPRFSGLGLPIFFCAIYSERSSVYGFSL